MTKEVKKVEQVKYKERTLTPVKVKVKANSTGYYQGRIIREGESFMLEANIVDGKFPLWVDVPEDYVLPKAKKEEPKADSII